MMSLQILRSIDKKDRVGDVGVFQLLTSGRRDESGAFTDGCGLATTQAAAIVGFINSGRENSIARRFWLMTELELCVLPSGATAWDVLLEKKPENIGWALDDLFAALECELGRDPRGPEGNGRTLMELARFFEMEKADE